MGVMPLPRITDFESPIQASSSSQVMPLAPSHACSSRFADPASVPLPPGATFPGSVWSLNLPRAAEAISARFARVAIVNGASSSAAVGGCRCRYSAVVPATIGEAIEVPPLSFRPPATRVQSAARMPVPGAQMPTDGPKLENTAGWSSASLAPTASANAEAAGYCQVAGHDSLPAATITGMPCSVTLLMASSNTAACAPLCWPLSDMFTTAGSCTLPGISTQFSAATALENRNLPWLSLTANDTMLAPGATPVVAPAAQPATCVP